jgi:hypothetical protein
MASIVSNSKLNIYSLKDFTNISFDGFNYSLPEETIQIISSLSLKVGSPSYIKTPVFRKRENTTTSFSFDSSINPRKKKTSKNMEVINDEDWEALRSFQTTKIEKKNGLESQVDNIRSYLNKMTDKNYVEMKNKIFDLLAEMDNNNISGEINSISFIIFDIASTNRFYSKIYADFYSELIQKYESMRNVFQDSFDNFLDLFHDIEYVDSLVDYDKFCKINKDNEKRKSLSTFFINLMINKIISKEKIIDIIHDLLKQVYQFIYVENKKNEVDELTENIVLLLRKDLFSATDYQTTVIDGKNILQLVVFFANSKVKDYKSLTNKSVFKYMDMIDM